jgi:hypothetical protein
VERETNNKRPDKIKEKTMFRNFTILAIAIAALPTSAFAAGPNPPSHTNVHVSTAAVNKSFGFSGGQKTGITKTDIHVTNVNLTNNNKISHDNKLFDIHYKGVGPKVNAADIKKFDKKFDADYFKKFGTKFDHGFFYKGKHHNHWSYRCWYPEFGCYCYWDPCLCEYFYFCEPDCCFYPISYCPYHRYVWPTVFVVETIPVVQVVTLAPVVPVVPVTVVAPVTTVAPVATVAPGGPAVPLVPAQP